MPTLVRQRSAVPGISHIVAGIAALLFLFALSPPGGARAEGAAVFMQRVANQLVAASRSGSASEFAAALRSHGDLPSIGLYALGSYRSRLSAAERPNFYAAMTSWIARYVASKVPEYPVVSAVILGQTEETRNGAYVDSRVTVKDGTTYDVRWWLVRRGSTFKVGDAIVLGFSARDQLKSLFENYLAENGGNPRALTIALNR